MTDTREVTEVLPTIVFSENPTERFTQRLTELRNRDLRAIEYANSALNTGDTLVFIDYPNGKPIYDSFGIQLLDRFIVHKEKMLATGSEKFKKMYEEWPQHRNFRKYGYVGANKKFLPPGVEYVLDLTPALAEDDAIESILSLSCPRGIKLWYKSADRLLVSRDRVCGKDESTERHFDIPNQPASPSQVTFDDIYPQPGSPFKGKDKIKGAAVAAGPDADLRLQAVLEESIATSHHTTARIEAALTPEEEAKQIPDYSPVRHRTGIERLLRTIEGKDPNLDSAVKVWTLCALAKFFECPLVVADWVTAWVTMQPNCAIIDTLPESIFRLGMNIENSCITRSAFSILVSEEALRLSITSDSQPFQPRSETDFTFFGRPIEHLDEDSQTLVQHAGQEFKTRVDGVFNGLFGDDLLWLNDLPEYQKLRNFRFFHEGLRHEMAVTNNNFDMSLVTETSDIEALSLQLRDYVHGRLMCCLITNPSIFSLQRGDIHRRNENYLDQPREAYSSLYNKLPCEGRIMTRTFWELVQKLCWDTTVSSNTTCEASKNIDEFLKKHGINRVTIDQLFRTITGVQNAILTRILESGYNDGVVPDEAYPLKFNSRQRQDMNDAKSETWNSQAWQEDILPEYISSGSNTMTDETSNLSVNRNGTPSVQNISAIPHSSPFFDIDRFLQQVRIHVQRDCHRMIRRITEDDAWQRGEETLCDTLLCLSEEEEMKFLPLWAGGLNDGSGGVFQSIIPEAEHGVPNGPGPIFHTGSTLDSESGDSASTLDFDRASMISDSTGTLAPRSLDAENGLSENLHRLAVVSVDSDMSDAINISTPTSTVRGDDDSNASLGGEEYHLVLRPKDEGSNDDQFENDSEEDFPMDG